MHQSNRLSVPDKFLLYFHFIGFYSYILRSWVQKWLACELHRVEKDLQMRHKLKIKHKRRSFGKIHFFVMKKTNYIDKTTQYYHQFQLKINTSDLVRSCCEHQNSCSVDNDLGKEIY